MAEPMPDASRIRGDQYVAMRAQFVLKIDGHRPVVYPLDYVNTIVYFLEPMEGLSLALLRGDQRFSHVCQLFGRLFAGTAENKLRDILTGVDARVRSSPSPTGIGRDGILNIADAPIVGAPSHDPRSFIVDPRLCGATCSHPKTRYRLETPIVVYTVFTHRCFTQCVYCYAERRKVSEMPLSRWRHIIREMADLGIRLAGPDNGDVFARADGTDFYECLLEHDMHFLLSTKAHVSKEQVRRLVAAGFASPVNGVINRQVQLSVDAADAGIATRILGVRQPRTHLSLDTFDNFMASGIMPRVKAVVTGMNHDQLKPIVDLFYPHGARRFTFVRYHRSFHRHTDGLFLERSHVPAVRRQLAEIRTQYDDAEIEENLSAIPSPNEENRTPTRRELWEQRIGCGGGWYALGISADGTAFLCEQMKIDEDLGVGDARSESIAEIWHGDRMYRFIHPTRSQFTGTVCQNCADFENCMWEKGRCYRDAFFSYGSIYEPPPLCPHNSRPGLRLS